MKESADVIAARFYTILHWQLAGQIPRPGGIHIYSRGATYMNMTTTEDLSSHKWVISLSPGVPYSAFEFGYGANGQRLTPRIPRPTKSNPNPKRLEERNFNIVPKVTLQVARMIAIPRGGKVIVK